MAVGAVVDWTTQTVDDTRSHVGNLLLLVADKEKKEKNNEFSARHNTFSRLFSLLHGFCMPVLVRSASGRRVVVLLRGWIMLGGASDMLTSIRWERCCSPNSHVAK